MPPKDCQISVIQKVIFIEWTNQFVKLLGDNAHDDGFVNVQNMLSIEEVK